MSSLQTSFLPLQMALFNLSLGLHCVDSAVEFKNSPQSQRKCNVAFYQQLLTLCDRVAELVSAKQRGFFLALNVGLSLGFAPGLLYANLLSSGSDWRWLYWISLSVDPLSSRFTEFVLTAKQDMEWYSNNWSLRIILSNANRAPESHQRHHKASGHRFPWHCPTYCGHNDIVSRSSPAQRDLQLAGFI